jgi:hypothetical protein
MLHLPLGWSRKYVPLPQLFQESSDLRNAMSARWVFATTLTCISRRCDQWTGRGAGYE